jgi:HSP20 family protein
VIVADRELILELGVPGVEREEIEVDVEGSTLTVSGARHIDVILNGRVYLHAEMARGPFLRTIRLPEPVSGAPRVEVQNGVIRIRLTKTTKSERPRA